MAACGPSAPRRAPAGACRSSELVRVRRQAQRLLITDRCRLDVWPGVPSGIAEASPRSAGSSASRRPRGSSPAWEATDERTVGDPAAAQRGAAHPWNVHGNDRHHDHSGADIDPASHHFHPSRPGTFGSIAATNWPGLCAYPTAAPRHFASTSMRTPASRASTRYLSTSSFFAPTDARTPPMVR